MTLYVGYTNDRRWAVHPPGSGARSKAIAVYDRKSEAVAHARRIAREGEKIAADKTTGGTEVIREGSIKTRMRKRRAGEWPDLEADL